MWRYTRKKSLAAHECAVLKINYLATHRSRCLLFAITIVTRLLVIFLEFPSVPALSHAHADLQGTHEHMLMTQNGKLFLW